MITRGIKYILISIATIALSACTKENVEDCYQGVELDYEFTFHTNESNKFDEEVHRVRTYLFDESGVIRFYAVDDGRELKEFFMNNGRLDSLVTVNPWGALPNEYVMRLSKVTPGRYSIFSFAGSGKNGNTTYFHGHMNDPQTHDFERGITLGKTTKDDFRLFIEYKEAKDYQFEDIIPIADEIDDLYYGAVGTRDPQTARYTFETVVVKSGETTRKHIELIRNTNLLKVTVEGIDKIGVQANFTRATPVWDQSNMKLWVRARNGRYKYDDSPGENARSIRYHPKTASVSPTTVVADIKVLRLDMENRQAEPMYLFISVTDPVTGKEKIYPEGGVDVVNTLLQAKDDKGNYVYKNPADFVKEYEHPIEIKFSADLQMRIFVHGWEVINVKPEM